MFNENNVYNYGNGIFDIEKIKNEVLEDAEKLGHIRPMDYFENELEAESKGFFWFDEILKWGNPDAITKLAKQK